MRCLTEFMFVKSSLYADQFENNRADNKILRWNYIPTIFSHKKVEKQRKPLTVRCNTEIHYPGRGNEIC